MRPILIDSINNNSFNECYGIFTGCGKCNAEEYGNSCSFGLLYATLMTLFIVPVMYDILYRKQPKEIDVGSDLDEIPDETSEYLESKENAKDSEIEDNQ